jgi:hypothetical protein
VITFPDLPPHDRKYSRRHPRFDYNKPLKADPYNYKVARGLATLLVSHLQSIPSEEIAFPVQDAMLEVDTMLDEVVDVARYTKKLWIKRDNKTPSTELDADVRRHKRHHGRKDRVHLLHQCCCYNSLSF